MAELPRVGSHVRWTRARGHAEGTVIRTDHPTDEVRLLVSRPMGDDRPDVEQWILLGDLKVQGPDGKWRPADTEEADRG